MLILEALNYSDDGEDGSKDYFVASKEVLGDGSSKLMNLYFQIIILNLQKHDLFAIIFPGKS